MGIVVTFNQGAWINAFPNINVTAEQLTNVVLPIATQYCRNDGPGPVNNVGVATQLLNLIVAHVAILLYGTVTNPADPTIVGRLSDAGQGSVHVSLDWPEPNNPVEAWYNQTQYGVMYFQMLRPYTLFRFVPAPRHQRVLRSPGWPF